MEAEERPSKLRKLEHDPEDPAYPSTVSSGAHNELPPSKRKTNVGANGTASDDVAHDDNVSENETDKETGAPLNTSYTTSSQPMSKNQQKRIRKHQEWEAGRDFRKERRRQRIKEKKIRRREERQAEKQQQIDTETTSLNSKVLTPRRPRWHVRIPVAIVIDCGFDEYMMEKEKISLGSQLTRAYSDNTKAPFQSHFYVSSWSGELKQRFETVLQGHYKNWANVTFTDKDFVDAAVMAREAMMHPVGRDKVKDGVGAHMKGAFEKYSEAEQRRWMQPEKPGNGTVADASNEAPDMGGEVREANSPQDSSSEHKSTDGSDSSSFSIPATAKDSIIYLTSESSYTLTHLSPYHTYIVGGIVDKNRHKGLCYKTACDRGVKTAKLPISDYMTMRSRSVLATNHVVEIMLKWMELGDWGEAFLRVMPSRKGGELKSNVDEQGKRSDDEGGAEDEHSDVISESVPGQAVAPTGCNENDDGDETSSASV